MVEKFVQAARVSLQEAREGYSRAISQRSGSQREVNELLQRKHAWTPNDLERFTELYRSDHANEQAEAAAQAKLVAVEKQAEEASSKLSACILARYHEEQIWSDKIRRMSTWGTWGLMGINILLFVIFQIGVEPWRRQRLVRGFEEKVMEALEREGSATTTMTADQTQSRVIADTNENENITSKQEVGLSDGGSTREQAQLRDEAATESPVTKFPSKPRLSKLDTWKEAFGGVFSEERIVVRRVDLTRAKLEGTAAGVAFVGVLVLLLRPH